MLNTTNKLSIVMRLELGTALSGYRMAYTVEGHREPRSLLDKVDLVFSSEFSGSFQKKVYYQDIVTPFLSNAINIKVYIKVRQQCPITPVIIKC
jgi:hypothetical protein